MIVFESNCYITHLLQLVSWKLMVLVYRVAIGQNPQTPCKRIASPSRIEEPLQLDRGSGFRMSGTLGTIPTITNRSLVISPAPSYRIYMCVCVCVCVLFLLPFIAPGHLVVDVGDVACPGRLDVGVFRLKRRVIFSSTLELRNLLCRRRVLPGDNDADEDGSNSQSCSFS